MADGMAINNGYSYNAKHRYIRSDAIAGSLSTRRWTQHYFYLAGAAGNFTRAGRRWRAKRCSSNCVIIRIGPVSMSSSFSMAKAKRSTRSADPVEVQVLLFAQWAISRCHH